MTISIMRKTIYIIGHTISANKRNNSYKIDITKWTNINKL